MVSLYLYSYRSNALRVLEGYRVGLKCTSRVTNGDEVVAGRNYRE